MPFPFSHDTSEILEEVDTVPMGGLTESCWQYDRKWGEEGGTASLRRHQRGMPVQRWAEPLNILPHSRELFPPPGASSLFL